MSHANISYPLTTLNCGSDGWWVNQIWEGELALLCTVGALCCEIYVLFECQRTRKKVYGEKKENILWYSCWVLRQNYYIKNPESDECLKKYDMSWDEFRVKWISGLHCLSCASKCHHAQHREMQMIELRPLIIPSRTVCHMHFADIMIMWCRALITQAELPGMCMNITTSFYFFFLLERRLDKSKPVPWWGSH